MNGWDALKTCGGTSNRRVRQHSDGQWLRFRGVRLELEDGSNVTIYRDEMGVDTWEVEPRSVEVTREKLAEAWDEHVVSVGAARAPRSTSFLNFCRALGLDP